MNLSLIYENALKNSPEKKAVILEDEYITYSELEKNANKVAYLLKKLGVKKGDRVGFMSENSIFLPIGYIGCFKIGACAVPASYYTSTAELEYEANSCEVKVYFVSKDRYEIVKQAAKNIKTLKYIITIDFEEKNESNIISWLKEKDNLPTDNICENVEYESPALILYTSGSTGKTKGVTHTVKSLWANAKFRTNTLKHTPEDAMITTSMLCHGAAPLIVLFPMLYCGGTSVFMKHFNPELFVNMLKKYKITHAAASPMEWKELVKIDNLGTFEYLKYATTGGDVVDKNLRKKFKEKFGVPLVSSLGMTECGGYMTIPPHKKPNDESVGMPLEGVSVKIVNENYEELHENEVGEILVKGDNVFKGYFNDEELTKNSFIDGYFKTGDLGRFDKDGYYYFEGRKKRIIIKGGGNINPHEIEDHLNKHPEVEISIVVGVKDEKLGEDVFAFVLPKDKNNPPEKLKLIEFLKGKISDRKLPAYIEFLKELPLKHKIDLKKLKEKAQIIADSTEKII